MSFFKKLKSVFKKPRPAADQPKAGKKPVPKPKKEVKIVEPEIKKPSAKRPPTRKKRLQGVYGILKEPHISEKATFLTDQNKYVFKIHSQANKIKTKKAIESFYGVKVKNVNIINIHRKKRILRGIKGFKTGYKKAIVTLKKGEKIEITPR